MPEESPSEVATTRSLRDVLGFTEARGEEEDEEEEEEERGFSGIRSRRRAARGISLLFYDLTKKWKVSFLRS